MKFYYLFFKRVKKGQIWRFQTDKEGIYLDYKVLEVKKGWVLYAERISGAKDYAPIFDFKVGMKPIKRS